MRNRTLPLALLIAASLAPVAGCSDSDNGSSADQNNDLAAGRTDSGSSDQSPLPVNDPGSAKSSSQPAAETSANSQSDQKLSQLEQQVQAMSQAADKRSQRLDDQAKRISDLKSTVDDLEIRLRRLPQPTQSSKSDKPGQPSKTPDTVSPQTQDGGQPRESHASKQSGQSSGNGDKASDDESSGAADSTSPPGDAIGACSNQADRGHQFDVFFQGASNDALNRAIDTVKNTDIDDWFARRSRERLYLGRYNRCADAARRRDAVEQTTDLSLYIAATQAAHESSGHTAQQSENADYGASEHGSSTDSQPSTRSVASAPFNLISVEMRGTHRFLGVASHDAARLSAITWLTPGDQYAGWQLQAIRPNAGRALFIHNQRKIALPLPDRG